MTSNAVVHERKDADIAAKVLNRDFRCGGFFERPYNEAFCFGH